MQQPEAYSGVENLEIMREAENYNRFLLATVRRHAPRSGRILDFGAGTGEFAIPMTAAGYDLTALEPDDGMRTRLAGKSVKTAAGPDEIESQSLAYVYTLNVLEHIDDDGGALRAVHSKLASGGRLLIYVPALPILYTSMDSKVGHVRRYTRTTLLAAVKNAGFDVASIEYVDSIGFFATLAFKFTDKGAGMVNRGALRLYDQLIFPLSRLCDLLAYRWFGKNLLLLARKK